MYLGDVRLGDTLDFNFTTRKFSTGAPFTLAGSPVISAYVGSNQTELTAGITLTADYDSRTGLNHVTAVLTSGNGYATATDITFVITTGTVDSVSVVGEVIGSCSIEKRSALMPTTAARTLLVSAAGAADANLVGIDGQATTGNNATLKLKQLDITNSAGTAVVFASTGSNGKGLDVSGNGSGAGILATGGSSGAGIQGQAGSGSTKSGIVGVGDGVGNGIKATGGDTGAGFRALGGATSGAGASLESTTSGNGLTLIGIGAGHGLSATPGATGIGIKAIGGATSGAAVSFAGTAGNAEGLLIAGQGSANGILTTGGATGAGLKALGGATSGAGAIFWAQTSGAGINAAGVGTGAGISSVGGATAGNGIEGLTTGSGGAGILGNGTGTGVGISGIGGLTGIGIKGAGGATSGAGAAFVASAGNSDGATFTKQGSGKDINAHNSDISGVEVVSLTAAGLATYFTVNSGQTYGTSVAGSVVKEIADNASGGSTPAAIATAVWNEAVPGAFAAGSAGFILGTNLNATISSRMATYTQPTGFLAATFPAGTVASTTNLTAGTIATVTNDVGITQAGADKVWGTAARTLTSGANIVLAKGVGVTGFNDLSAAQVNAEVVDALSVDTYAEPTGVPPATDTLANKIGRVHQALRNGLDVDSNTGFKHFKNDALAIIWKKSVADAGGVYTEGEGEAP